MLEVLIQPQEHSQNYLIFPIEYIIVTNSKANIISKNSSKFILFVFSVQITRDVSPNWPILKSLEEVPPYVLTPPEDERLGLFISFCLDSKGLLFKENFEL